MAWAYWMLFIILGSLFAYAAIFNGVCLVRMLSNRRSPSQVPFVGGVLGAVAFATSPISILKSYWWVPFLLDTSFPLFVIALPMMVREAWRVSRWNLLREYCFQDEQILVRLYLYGGGTCILSNRFQREPGELGTRAWSLVGDWTEREGTLHVVVGGTELQFLQEDRRVQLGQGAEIPDLINELPPGLVLVQQ